ncbi:MAG: hypothetical protein KI792_08700 [Alphaproteobacteria bacterium]|nr:hypothetical protein [Alphaproteobacteria bacterium SS10]
MSILDQISVEQQASFGPLTNPGLGIGAEGSIASGAGQADITAQVMALLPALKPQSESSDPSIETALPTSSVSAGIDNRAASDCAYPGLGCWAVQLGEATLDNGQTRFFINVVDGFGKIVIQLHGVATDRTFGDVYLQGGEIDHQLQLFAFIGDFFGDVPRLLHPLHPVGDQAAMMALLSQIAAAADRISTANIDYVEDHPAADRGAAQDENSVVATLIDLIGRVVPSFDNRKFSGWQTPSGLQRNLDRRIDRPFHDDDDLLSEAMPPAPSGRIAPFSKAQMTAWFRSAARHQYRTTVPAARLPF